MRARTVTLLVAIASLAASCAGTAPSGSSSGSPSPTATKSPDSSAQTEPTEGTREPSPEKDSSDAFRRTPGRVKGRVTDESARPLRGICVDVWRDNEEEWVLEQDVARTDAKGRYEADVSDAFDEPGAATSGAFTLRFRDCARRIYAFEWYEDVPDVSRATILDAGKGAVADAALGRGASLSGTVRDSLGGAIEGLCVHLYDGTLIDNADEDQAYTPYASAFTGPNGGYSFRGLAGKGYRIYFDGGTKGSAKNPPDCTGGRFESEWYRDRPGDFPPSSNCSEERCWPPSDVVELRPGEDRRGIDAEMDPCIGRACRVP